MNIMEMKESSAVQTHINMLQGIISRMASNSANCKTWAVAILTALIALFADGKLCNSQLWVCYIPIALFAFLDCYYLGLERHFRKKQRDFVNKVNDGDNSYLSVAFTVDEMHEGKGAFKQIWHCLKGFGSQCLNTILGAFSFSTLPFYGAMIILVYVLIHK
jgi:hypothetical protein